MAIITKTRSNNCWQGCGEKRTLCTVGGKCVLVQLLWKIVWRFLKILKIEPPYNPKGRLQGIYPKEMKHCLEKISTRFCSLQIIPKAERWKNNLSVHHYMSRYRKYHTYIQWSIIQPLKKKKKEILPFVTTWMGLRGIILSEISQKKKDKYFTISLICGTL